MKGGTAKLGEMEMEAPRMTDVDATLYDAVMASDLVRVGVCATCRTLP